MCNITKMCHVEDRARFPARQDNPKTTKRKAKFGPKNSQGWGTYSRKTINPKTLNHGTMAMEMGDDGMGTED